MNNPINGLLLVTAKAVIVSALAALTACGGDPQSATPPPVDTAPVISPAPAPPPSPSPVPSTDVALLDPVRDQLVEAGIPQLVMEHISKRYPNQVESPQRDALAQVAKHYARVLSLKPSQYPTDKKGAELLMNTETRKSAVCSAIQNISSNQIERDLLEIYWKSHDTVAKVELEQMLQKLAGYVDLSEKCPQKAGPSEVKMKTLAASIYIEDCKIPIYFVNGVGNSLEMTSVSNHALRELAAPLSNVCVAEPMFNQSHGITADIARTFKATAGSSDDDAFRQKIEYVVYRVFGTLNGVVNTQVNPESVQFEPWLQENYNRLQSDINFGKHPLIVAHSGGTALARLLINIQYYRVNRVDGKVIQYPKEWLQALMFAAPIAHNYMELKESHVLYAGDKVIKAASGLGILGEYWKPTVSIFAEDQASSTSYLGHGFMETYLSKKERTAKYYLAGSGLACPYEFVSQLSMFRVAQTELVNAVSRVANSVKNETEPSFPSWSQTLSALGTCSLPTFN